MLRSEREKEQKKAYIQQGGALRKGVYLEPGHPGGALLAQGWITHHDVGHDDRQHKVDGAEPEIPRVHLLPKHACLCQLPAQ